MKCQGQKSKDVQERMGGEDLDSQSTYIFQKVEIKRVFF